MKDPTPLPATPRLVWADSARDARVRAATPALLTVIEDLSVFEAQASPFVPPGKPPDRPPLPPGKGGEPPGKPPDRPPDHAPGQNRGDGSS